MISLWKKNAYHVLSEMPKMCFFRTLVLWHVNRCYAKRKREKKQGAISLANGRLYRFLYHRTSQGL